MQVRQSCLFRSCHNNDTASRTGGYAEFCGNPASDHPVDGIADDEVAFPVSIATVPFRRKGLRWLGYCVYITTRRWNEVRHNHNIWKDPDTFDPERFPSRDNVDQIDKLPWTNLEKVEHECASQSVMIFEI
ncbi:hypothetical protein BJV82DRAFT_576099 [Fennellomyces sp. T-0311]|nr:hypothetical protein BJV82DRAFT_576099 [Fennellomyces sp. T-0311]